MTKGRRRQMSRGAGERIRPSSIFSVYSGRGGLELPPAEGKGPSLLSLLMEMPLRRFQTHPRRHAQKSSSASSRASLRPVCSTQKIKGHNIPVLGCGFPASRCQEKARQPHPGDCRHPWSAVQGECGEGGACTREARVSGAPCRGPAGPFRPPLFSVVKM